MKSSVGLFEAKTHLARLLVRVSKGERITITKRGVPMAVMVPPESIMDVKKAMAAMTQFHQGNAPKLGPELTIQQLIEEGRG